MKMTNIVIFILVIVQFFTLYKYFKLSDSHEKLTDIVEHRVDPIPNKVATLLIDNDKFQNQVRGPEGPPGKDSNPDVVAKLLIDHYDDAFKVMTANYDTKYIIELESIFWEKRKLFILENPGLIADTAEVVYQTYGNKLRGEKGQDAHDFPAREIARLLTNDVKFAQLVADFKD